MPYSQPAREALEAELALNRCVFTSKSGLAGLSIDTIQAKIITKRPH